MTTTETESEAEFLRSVARDFFSAAEVSVEVHPPGADAVEQDRDRWRQLSSDLGFTGIVVPEDLGGAGGTFAELAVVLQESGRSLATEPLLASAALAALTLLTIDDRRAMERFLPAIADGSSIATVALAAADGLFEPTSAEVRAMLHDGAWSLTGARSHILNGPDAALLLVSALTEVGVGLFAVEAGAAGLSIDVMPVLDQTRSLGTARFDRVPAHVVGRPGACAAALDRSADIAMIALAAEQLGGARRCLELAVDYAKGRIAFGRPIGSFQAVKHKAADVAFRVEAVSCLLDQAVRAVVEGDDLAFTAAALRVAATDAFVLAASENIQIHGGVGFTWEYPAHRYYKRAYASKALLGSTTRLRSRIAARYDAPVEASVEEGQRS